MTNKNYGNDTLGKAYQIWGNDREPMPLIWFLS